jgi:hypothetical protein
MSVLLARPRASADECIISYLIRLSELNGFRHVGHLLKFAGLAWKNNRIPVHTILTGEHSLAPYFSNLHLENVPSFGSRIVHSFRRAIDTPYVFVKYPKICPQCLADKGYCNYLWAFLPVTACNIHRTLLIDAYQKTGERLSWYRRRVDGYDEESGALKPVRLPAKAPILQFNKYVEALVTGDASASDAPVIMKELSFRESLTCINFLAQYTARAGGSGFHPYQLKNSDLAAIYLNVWRLLKKWPDGLYALFSQFINNPMSVRGVSGLNKHFRDIHEQLYRRQENAGLALIKEEFDRYIDTYWPGVLEKDRLIRINVPSVSNIISKKEAALIIGCRPERIDKLVRLNQLTRVVFRGKAHYLRDEAVALAEMHRENWTMSQACSYMQISRYQLKLLLAADVLVAIQKPDKLNRDWIIDRQECERLIGRLIKNARTEFISHISISMAGVLHQGFSIVDLVLLMLDGALSYNFENDEKNPLSMKQFNKFVFIQNRLSSNAPI